MTTLRHARHCSTRTCALAVLVCSLVWSAAPTTVHAVPTFSAEIPGVERVNASPTPVFLSNRTEIIDRGGAGNVVIGQKTRQAIAAASYGQLRGSANADYLNVSDFFPIFSGSFLGAQESSDFFLDDLVITGPPGNIIVSFNFVIAGSIGASTVSTGPSEFYQSSARVKARVINLQSSLGGAGAELGEMNVNSFGEVTRTGIFSTFPMNSDGMAVGETPSIMTFAGDPALQIWLGLETGAFALVGFGAGSGRTHGFASFGDTFGFPTSGPVANLPEGYTLNSLDGHIVNNRLVVAEQVPEPSSLVLVLVAAGVLILRKRSQRPFMLQPS